MYYQHGQDRFHPPTNLGLRRPEYPLLPQEQASPEPWLDGSAGSHRQPSVVDFKTDMSPVINPLTTATTATFPSSLPAYLHRPSPMQTSLAGHRVPLAGDGPVRRVCSTGDLDVQRMGTSGFHHGQRSESPLGPENGGLDQMAKVGRYTAEERKERIERYRSKRNQRNFNKKIKYACRKTLADSRPRVRGRFARNDEAGETSGCSWITTGGEEEEEEEDDWLNFLDAFSTI